MSKLSGVVLVLAGVGIAVYSLPSSHDTGTVASRPPQPQTQATGQIATVALQKAPVVAEQQAPAPVARPDSPPPAPVAQPPPPLAKIIPVQAQAGVPPPRIPLGQYTPAAGPPLDQRGLAREIQRELKRVGCYAGDVNGVWSPAARRAMKTFTDRVNASLPVEQPDYILLAMVQNHQDKACGQPCPTGQAPADSGRCLPNAIIAGGAKKQAPAEPATASAPAAATPAAVPTPEGRMALAGPQPEGQPEGTSPLASPLPPPGIKREGQKGAHARSTRGPGYTDAGSRDRRRGLGGTSNRMPRWWAEPVGSP